jgi:hypothetical protein
MTLQKKINKLLYKYELENDCMTEPSWEELVTGINEAIKEKN